MVDIVPRVVLRHGSSKISDPKKMKHVKALVVLSAALAAMPAVSFAQQLASVSGHVNLRAGPSTDYPIIAVLPAGIDISVIGCLSGYHWCDVVAGPDRGWVYAGNIVYPYQNANVPLLTYGAIIGIGIIAFDLGHYWDEHYRTHPWYRQRQYWIGRQRHDFHRGAHPPAQVVPPLGFRAERHPGQARGPALAPPPLRDHGAGPAPVPRHVPGQAQRPLPRPGPGASPHPAPGQGHGANPRPHGVQNTHRGQHPPHASGPPRAQDH